MRNLTNFFFPFLISSLALPLRYSSLAPPSLHPSLPLFPHQPPTSLSLTMARIKVSVCYQVNGGIAVRVNLCARGDGSGNATRVHLRESGGG